MNMKPIVLITGCSSGFGLLIACELAQSCHVIATMRDLSKKGALVNALAQIGEDVDIRQCDVTDIESVQSLMTYIEVHYGKLTVLVNNAGYAAGGFFEDFEEQQIRDQMETNFFAVQSMIREALPLLRLGSPSKIINMSSISGRVSFPCVSAYNASKWAVEGFSEALLFELMPFDIDVVLIEPGQFSTRIFSSNLSLAADINNPDSLYYESSKKLMALFKKKTTSLPPPVRVARLCRKIVFTRSPKFRYVIGKDAWFRVWIRRLIPFELYKYCMGFLYQYAMKSR